jgi:hypothetical protein
MGNEKFFIPGETVDGTEHYIAPPAFIIADAVDCLETEYGDTYNNLSQVEQMKLQVEFSKSLSTLYSAARLWEIINLKK